MLKRVFAVGFIVLLVAASAAIAETAHRNAVTEANSEQVITNEQWTVTVGMNELDASNLDAVYSETANVSQGSTIYEEEGNYTWHIHNGTIEVPASTQLTTGNSAKVDYRYTEPSAQQTFMREVTLLLPESLGEIMMLVAGFALVFGALAVMGREAA